MTQPRLRFPDGFTWGTATASYQIEGAVTEDGRARSIWDTFSHTPGRILDGTTGDVACDHYHRVDADVALMAEIGLPAYRFSVAWPRVVPTGGGAVNQAGLDFYSRLVDTLLAREVTPLVTLYHWDLPQSLQDAGGWTNRDTAERFAEYAAVVGAALGDRVPTFTTFNEPWCSAYLGYGSGHHAPGEADGSAALAAVHHLNLAHGRATSALRSVLPATGPSSGQVSITLNLAYVQPASEQPEDVRAAEHVDALANRIFLDPILRGEYPAQLQDDLRHVTDWSFVRDGDTAAIAQPLDVLGINYYTPTIVRASTTAERATWTARWSDEVIGALGGVPYPGTDLAVQVPKDGPLTAMGWLIAPETLTALLERVHRDYPGIPIVITENGAAFGDEPGADGVVHDADRIEYLRAHVAAVHEAIGRGVDVRGYYAWSLMDNFEWAFGLSRRFGLVHVDYDSLVRTPKDSFRWYGEVIAANGVA